MDPLFEQYIDRRRLLRGAVAGGATLSLGGLLAACGSGASGDPATTAKQAAASGADVAEVTWSFPATPTSLDYVRGYDDANVHSLANVHGGLLTYGDDASLQPYIAESWTQPDNLTYEYKLRKDVKFSDGTPLTADDAVFSLGQLLDPKSQSGLTSFFQNVKSVEAPDAHTVRVNMKRPDPLFSYIAAHAGGWITSKRVAERYGSKIGTPDALPVGAGPYKIVKYIPNDRVVYEVNEHYFGERPKVQRLTLRFIPDNATRLLALRSGEIDGGFQVPIEDAATWQQVDSAHLVTGPSASLALLAFNTQLAPFDDIHVRKAFAYAFDAAGISKDLFHGFAKPSLHNSYAPQNLWAGVGVSAADASRRFEQLPAFPFDVAKARAELAKSGHPDGFSTHVDYMDAQPKVGKALLVLKQALEQIGVNLSVGQLSASAWLAAYSDLSKPITAVVGFADYPDPFDVYYINFDSKFAVPNLYNYTSYKNPAVDKICDEYLDTPTTDKTKRVELAQQAMEIIQNDVPQVQMWYEDAVAAMGKELVYEGWGPWYFFQPWATHLRAAAT